MTDWKYGDGNEWHDAGGDLSLNCSVDVTLRALSDNVPNDPRLWRRCNAYCGLPSTTTTTTIIGTTTSTSQEFPDEILNRTDQINPNGTLDHPSDEPSTKSSSMYPIIGGVGGGLLIPLLIVIGVMAYCFCPRQKQIKEMTDAPEKQQDETNEAQDDREVEENYYDQYEDFIEMRETQEEIPSYYVEGVDVDGGESEPHSPVVSYYVEGVDVD